MSEVDTTLAPTLIRIGKLSKEFPARDGGAPLVAVNEVSFEIRRGETLGLVGESGSGKTTVARMLVGLETPTSGSILFGDSDLATQSAREWRRVRRHIQMVFQDPSSSLNPRMTIRETLLRPLAVNGLEPSKTGRNRRVIQLLSMVGLRSEHGERYPHELSGGQQQRVGIARALALDPSLAVLDEPTSALDVSVQAQILLLLRRLQRDLQLTFLFISHDLSVVRFLSHRTAVMYRGRMMEIGATHALMRVPRHPYTRHLLGSVPRFYGGLPPIRSVEPTGEADPAGCPFYARCGNRLAKCRASFPELVPLQRDQYVACFNPFKEGNES